MKTRKLALLLVVTLLAGLLFVGLALNSANNNRNVEACRDRAYQDALVIHYLNPNVNQSAVQTQLLRGC